MTRDSPLHRADARAAALMVAPALAIIVLVALVPILATAWEALHADEEWEQATEMIRDAWELRRASLVAALAEA